MVACCVLCYEKYLNSDGTLDEDAFEQARLTRRVVDSRNRLVQETDVPPAGERQPCMCDCHTKGMTVLH